ncbi:MAG: aspartate dehydrogenase [Sarcina sp.]|nr:aspartate dehydrogenase [Sarcina sp.]
MFFFKKKDPFSGAQAPQEPYDPAVREPVLRCSICTGEQVAGFRDRKTGDFTEIMLIRNPADLEAFRKQYGIEETELKRIY